MLDSNLSAFAAVFVGIIIIVVVAVAVPIQADFQLNRRALKTNAGNLFCNTWQIQ